MKQTYEERRCIKRVCKNCENYRNTNKEENPECWDWEPTDSCEEWVVRKNYRRCAICVYYNTKECSSSRPNYWCDDWEEKNKPAGAPSNAEVRLMLKEGATAEEIAVAHSVEILPTYETPLHVDNPQILSLKQHLKTVFQCIPSLEEAVVNKPNQHNTYALTNLIEASRALMADINAREDPSEQYTLIMAEILEPLTKSFVALLATELSTLRSKVKDMFEDEKQKSYLTTMINQTIKGLAPEMKHNLQDAASKLADITGANSDILEWERKDGGRQKQEG